MTDLPERWEFDGRHYLITVFDDTSATREGLGWELEDVAPTPGRGNVLEAFRDDNTGALTVTALTDQPLPLALVQRFVTEAERDL
jgi:hypothetical protein